LPLGHTNFPQQPQYSGICAHIVLQAKLEQLKLSKTYLLTWP
jgi:hypothetical protein